jgi:uncharacterized protein
MTMLARLAHSLATAYDLAVLRRPALTVLVTMLLVAVLGTFAPRFELDASSDTLVMEHDEAVRFYRVVRAEYESDDFLVVTYTPHGGLFTERGLERLAALRDALLDLPQVAAVTTLLDVPILEGLELSLTELPTEPGALTCDGPDRVTDCRRALDSKLYRKLLVSTDGSTSGIRVDLRQDEEFRSLQRARDQLRIKAGQRGLDAEEQRELAALDLQISLRGATLRDDEAMPPSRRCVASSTASVTRPRSTLAACR